MRLVKTNKICQFYSDYNTIILLVSFDMSIHKNVKYLSRRDEVGQVQVHLMLRNGRKKL